MNDWGDAKTNIFEHIVISAAIFIGALFFDHFVNLLHAINIHLVRNETYHPYFIGEFQIISMALAAIQFVRKLNEWRYYSDIVPKKLRELVKNEI